MAKGKHSEAEIIGALKQLEARGRTAEDVGRRWASPKRHHLRLEGEVRWTGCERGAAAAAARG